MHLSIVSIIAFRLQCIFLIFLSERNSRALREVLLLRSQFMAVNERRGISGTWFNRRPL